MAKIMIIGSGSYKDRIQEHKEKLEEQGHTVLEPNFDKPQENELAVCDANIELINESDEVHLIWDGRSTGTIFDLGVVRALKKPLRVIYICTKSFPNVAKQMEAEWNG